jgi:hypothetical protein
LMMLVDIKPWRSRRAQNLDAEQVTSTRSY